MEKHLAQGSYWLGIVCAVVALAWKGLAALKLAPGAFGELQYTTFYKGGLLVLLIPIATAGCAWLKSQKG